MTKQSTITSLLVVPLIASAVFLASPAFASSSIRTVHKQVRNVTSKELLPNTKVGVTGAVTAINGNIILVTSESIEYTVDASKATIMKASDLPNGNPSIVHIADIKVGDSIVVRGEIKDSEITAQTIFDGKMAGKKGAPAKGKKIHSIKTIKMKKVVSEHF